MTFLRQSVRPARALLGFVLAMFASAVARPPALSAAPPAEVAAVAAHLPENTRVIMAVRCTSEVQEWMYGLFINPKIYKRIVTEQCEKFAKATGFHPLADVDWIVLALAEKGAGITVSLVVKTDAMKVVTAVKADPKSAPLLKTQTIKGATLVTAQSADLAVTSKLVTVAPLGLLKTILERGGVSPTNAAFLAAIPPQTGVAYVVGQPPPEAMADLANNPQLAKFGGAVLARVKGLSAGLDFKELAIGFKLDSADAAAVGADQLRGLITTAKGMLNAVAAKPPAAVESSPLDLIQPKVMVGRIAALTGLDALNAMVVAADGDVTRLTLPKDKVPLMRGESGMVLLMVGLAGGAALAARQAGTLGGKDVTACITNQHVLTGALELYNKEKKKKAKLEDVASELVSGNFLPGGLAEDPGQPAGSFKNYYTRPDGTIACKVHGSAADALTSPGSGTEPEGGGGEAARGQTHDPTGSPASPAPAASPASPAAAGQDGGAASTGDGGTGGPRREGGGSQ
jgi:hypothetical protein